MQGIFCYWTNLPEDDNLFSSIEQIITKSKFVYSAFATLDNSVQKVIITMDEVDYSTSTVKHITFKKFLFMDDLDS